MNIHNDILGIFEENGIEIDDKNSFKEMDSIQYISSIVEIEQKFNIVLPDYILSRDEIINFDQFIKVVVETYEKATEEKDTMLLK